MGLFLIFLIILYVGLAAIFLRFVRKKTSSKHYRRLAIALVLLFPSWEVLLGFIVYYPACLFVPKNAIYETAETEGIYYEGDASKFLLILSDGRRFINSAESDYRQGFKYAEALITETGDTYTRHHVSPVIYRCESIPLRPEESHKTPVDCKPVTSARSDYLVRTNIIAIGRAGHVQPGLGLAAPAWFLAIKVLIAPLVEEPLKVLPLLLRPAWKMVTGRASALWVGFVLGISLW
mgnify:CR=1 FL=1